jgi:hypothetical protein
MAKSFANSYSGRVIATVIAIVFIFVILHQNADNQSFIPSFAAQRAPSSRSDPKLRERMELSERNWMRSIGLRRKMAAEHPSNPQIPLFPAQSIPGFLKYPYTLWDFFPPTWTCPHDVQRVGRLGDGGKWVCGLSIYESVPVPSTWSSKIPADGQEGVVAYSFGINDESSFEAELLDRVRSARIWGYDFSVDAWGPQIPTAHCPRTFFSKVGISKTDEPAKTPPFWTLQSLMAQNNHTYIDILKIDVEGSEYTAFDSIMDYFSETWNGRGEAVLPIGQIMIEIHVGEDRPEIGFGRFRKWWERLESMGMRPTWMEMNLMAVTIPDHKTDPRCTEYVLVNARDERNLLWQ